MTATTVWMSVYRAGTPHHRVVPSEYDVHTACGRFISDAPGRPGLQLGVLLTEHEAADKGSPRCERCWPVTT